MGETAAASLAPKEGRVEPPEFTPRDLEIMNLVARGYSNEEIEPVVRLSYQSVKNELGIIFDSAGVSSRFELALYYVYLNTIGPESQSLEVLESEPRGSKKTQIFPIRLDLSFKPAGTKFFFADPTLGQSVRISTRTLTFSAENLPKLGCGLVVDMAWPVKNDAVMLKLVLEGKTELVNSGQKTAAMIIRKHTFMTAGLVTPSPGLSNQVSNRK